ncbi:MAG: hypothetical protein Q8910_00390 [Bacteroidota bacterium]|nr:hypothetical protein [Bacteroidota bacterium]
MAVGDMPFNSIEGTMYINLNQDADETVTDGWVRKAFVTGLTMDHNKNQIDVFDHYNKVGSKKGKNEIKGSIKQGYALYATSLMKLFKDNTSFAIRIDIQVDGEGPVVSQFYMKRCNFGDMSFDCGDINEGTTPMTFSGNYSISDWHWVDAA